MNSNASLDLVALERRIWDWDHATKPSGWSDVEKRALIQRLRALERVRVAAMALATRTDTALEHGGLFYLLTTPRDLHDLTAALAALDEK